MTRSGLQIVTAALRRIGIIDAIESAPSELEADAILVASEMLDSWAAERLLVRGVTRNVYSLTSGTQTYTIGTGGAFNQDYPNKIVRWGVIPDDDAANPVEIPRGRPANADEWSRIRVKTLQAAYPHTLYYDERYAAGLGNVLVYPVPDNNDVDVVLYCAIPQIRALVANTDYDLPPGYALAIITNLAIELADSYGKPISQRLDTLAKESKGRIKRANYVPRESPTRPEFAIGQSRGALNIYTDD